MEKKEMTVEDAVKKVIEVLDNLEVPISKMETIGMPVSGCIAILNGILHSWEEEEAKQAAAKEEKGE